jgi:hypothetical protein
VHAVATTLCCPQLPFFKNFMARRFLGKWRAAARRSSFLKVSQIVPKVVAHYIVLDI